MLGEPLLNMGIFFAILNYIMEGTFLECFIKSNQQVYIITSSSIITIGNIKFMEIMLIQVLLPSMRLSPLWQHLNHTMIYSHLY